MNARQRGVSTENGTALDAEGPLRRWARRRREVAREELELAEARRRDAPDDTTEVAEPAGDSTEPVDVEERVLTDEDMPLLDSLDENSDYSGFLSPGVSEQLRRRALRKLFSSAVFNVPDGLDDYDDDFTSFAALGDIVTSDMRHQAEVEAERAKQARAETESDSLPQDESGPGEGEPVVRTDEEAASLAEEVPPGAADPAAPEPPEVSVTEDSQEQAESEDPVQPESEPRSVPMHAGEPAGRSADDHERNA